MSMIARSFGYMDQQPVMIIRPTVRDNGKRFVIKLNDLWKYSEDHNELFEAFLANKMLQICDLFDISLPKGLKQISALMVDISGVIMDGIDELVKMRPYTSDVDPVICIGGQEQQPEMGVRMLS